MRTSRGFRRPARGATAVITLVLAFLVGAGSAQAIDVRAVTDDYLFARSLAEFSQIRLDRPHDGELDWSTDGCTSAPDSPFGFELLPACHRHDFGYRNYKRQQRFDPASRSRIDENFRADMYTRCGSNWACRRIADIYYYAVRTFGGSSASTAGAVDRVTARR
ncbi:phospholipase [Allokutzneria albata]|uniref:Phospholipase A2 n=1 Tax=Allokutzneria albata TaxID=211114 RepID=A0A1G9X5R8_ALLAB|nr:phospholipase [Allokutzneria albata]SDM91856.1 phospholipase A2 [Allokutzneria albata]